MDRTQSYERVIPQKNLKRRIIGITLYSMLAAGALSLSLSSMNIYVAALSVFALIIVILLTRKYLSSELEYSFIGGILTVSRIYGKSARRVVVEHELSNCIFIAHATEENNARAASMRPEKVYELYSANADGERIVIVTEEDDTKNQLFINADERTLALLYKANPSACTLEIRVKAR